MWTISYAADSTASPEAIWRHLADVDRWATWNDGVESIRLDGPFAVGSAFTMLTGGEQIRTRIAVVDAPRRYVDETDVGGAVVRVSHELAPLPSGGTRITFRLDVDGPDGDEVGPEIGPAISADFPAVIAKLARIAAS